MEDGPDLAEIIDAQGSNAVAGLLSEPTTDTTDPTAREWLKRWGASGLSPKPASCSCATGHCRICN
jgi:hypothetical protein